MAIDQSRDRTKTLGGSEMGTLMGVNDYENAVDLWLTKRGLKPPKDLSGNSKVYWGNMEEALVMDHYESLHGVKLERDGYVDGLNPSYLAANLDGFCRRDNLVIEVKTCSFMTYLKQFGEGFPVDGNDCFRQNDSEQIPASYMCQIQFYMWATKAPAAKLILKADSHIYVEYPIKRNEALINAMLAAADEFWQCVQAGTKIRPRKYAEALALWTPTSKESPVDANEDCSWSYAMLRDLKEQRERIELQEDQSKFVLMKHMQQHNATCIMEGGLKIASAFERKDGVKCMRVNIR